MLKEGRVSKGGLNQKPKTERPDKPKPQPGAKNTEDKLLVAEVNYVGIGSYTLLPSQFRSVDIEMMKGEVVDECLNGMGAIDEDIYNSEIQVTITFKNMTKEEIENMGEFNGF